MIVGSSIWNVVDTALLALTATERWSAVRRTQSPGLREYWPFLGTGLILLALIMLLWRVRSRRGVQVVGAPHDPFGELASQKKLSLRERQILTAVAVRSGLGPSHGVFTQAGAFERGATALLAECAQHRTPAETRLLSEEVNRLAEKLGHRQACAVEARIPARVARFPFMRSAATGPTEVSADVLSSEPLELVEAAITQVEGALLQLETALRVQMGDRVLVVFKLPQPESQRIQWLVVEHVGRVNRCRTTDAGVSMSVELVGLTGAEIGELARLAEGVGSRPSRDGNGGRDAPLPATAAVGGA